MKIFIELPTWLGDGVMASVAITNLARHYPDAHFTIFGSFVSCELYKEFSFVEKSIIDNSKKSGNRYWYLRNLVKTFEKFDLAFSFRSSFISTVLLFLLSAKKKYQYKRIKQKSLHQVRRYNDFLISALKIDLPLGDLELPFATTKSIKPLLGINPGATYGSAKRWYPKEFAHVAIALSDKYDIVIFGGPTEKDVAEEIEHILLQNGIENFVNLAGQTSIKELCQRIGGLHLFITNDSGPLHIAAVYKIPTIAIFGPTIAKETNGWHNPNELIITKKLDCQPCMKRVCPLGTHECMKLITAKDVLEALQ